jgi:hypothetical protein
MTVISTRRSRLDGVPTFRKATINPKSNLQELVHAGTKGGRQRIIGIKDWDGTYEEYGMVPTWFPGDSVTVTGSLDGSEGVEGDAIVTQTVITIPISDKTPPTIVGTFRGVGALSLDDSSAVALPSAQDIPEVANLCVLLAELSGSPSYSAQANTNEIVITLTADAQEYHDCGSSGWMESTEGLWDAEVVYKRRCKPSELPTWGGAYHVRVPIDAAASEYYQFEYMRVGDFSDITLDRETGELLNISIPLSMSMIESVGGSATIGTGVTKPDTTVWRPDET